jgi:hypothetical protein
MFPNLKDCRLQPPGHASSSLADFSTLKMEAIRSSETSVHTRSTRRHIPEDGILLSPFSFSVLLWFCWFLNLYLLVQCYHSFILTFIVFCQADNGTKFLFILSNSFKQILFNLWIKLWNVAILCHGVLGPKYMKPARQHETRHIPKTNHNRYHKKPPFVSPNRT